MPMPREPFLDPIDVAELRPTQMTVGLREVEEHRKRIRARIAKAGSGYVDRHMIPTVIGPKRRHYVVDHHHLARALHEEGVRKVLVTPFSDFSRLEQEEFWIVLDNNGLMHPFDAKGRRQSYKQIPHRISDLTDDPFRSLAGALRRAGGFAKETTPFSEFQWADYLRRRMQRSRVENDFSAALKQALKLAKSRDGDHLPGWCGPSPDRP